MSGSTVKTGSGLLDKVNYKSSTNDAQNTVNQWFLRGMGRAPTDAELQKWTQSVQRDGSHTAYLDFSGKISRGDPGAERRAAGANIAASGWNGYSPLAGSEHEGEQQLPGTKTGWLADAAPKLEGPAMAAGTALLTAGLSAPKVGPMGGSPTDGMSPDDIANVGNASAPVAGSMNGVSVADAGNASIPTGGGGGGGFNPLDYAKKLFGGGSAGGGIPGLGSLGGLAGLGSAANAAYLQDKSSNYAKLAGESVDRSYGERAGLRAAGIAGLGGGSLANGYKPTPIENPQLPQLAALGKVGNPFAKAGSY